MANSLQKIIYKVSNLIPSLFIFSIISYIFLHSTLILALSLLLALIFLFCFLGSFLYGNKHLARMKVNTLSLTKIDSNKFHYIMQVITGFIPLLKFFSNDIITDYIPLIYMLLTFLSAIFPSNFSYQNILLSLIGYNFYSCDFSTGVQGNILITRRNIRNSKDVMFVKRLFENMFIEVIE